MKYKYEDFNDYTLEESLEILREESKKRRIKADDLIIDIEEELKNQDESVAKCNELIQEIVDSIKEKNGRYEFEGVFEVRDKIVPFKRTMPKKALLSIAKVGR